jgi:hypothetical protein
MRPPPIAVSLAMACALAWPGHAQAPLPERNDYSKPETWLCRPGVDGACAADLTTTVIAADGTMTVQPFVPKSDPPIDCFYVYPTVSLDKGGNSDMAAGPEERNVIATQFARFGSECRLYAPLYRQFTLAALGAAMKSGGSVLGFIKAEIEVAYRDVVDAWHEYLARDNKGRGVVLIGHSQGSIHLMRLIREEIEGKAIQRQIVSALVIGITVEVPRGKTSGGTFKTMKLCGSTTQTGCIVSYVSFRSAVPPPDGALFGRTGRPGTEAACTNPASLGGGSGPLDSRFGRGPGRDGVIQTIGGQTSWVTPPRLIATPFVAVPGLLIAQCVSNEHGSYLEVTVNADARDPRTDEIPGDVMNAGKVAGIWGLHAIDMQLTIANLVGLVGSQSRAFMARAR